MRLGFGLIESVGSTASNVTMCRGVLRVNRNIVDADILNTYYAAATIKDYPPMSYEILNLVCVPVILDCFIEW